MSSPKIFSWPASFIPVLAGVVVVGICGGLYRWEANQIETTLRERETARVGVLVRLAGRDLRSAATDLRVLADGDGLRAYLNSGRQSDLDRAVRRAIFFSRQESDFDQVRYLDERGREVLRVNQGSGVVPPDQLQDKGGWPYFQKAQALAAEKIYVSVFDLNVEHGAIEQPFKPMLRFSTPVFDSAGRRRGVYVINYSGANLLARLQGFAPLVQHRLRVLNPQGYWLKAAHPAQEWGFMFPDRAGATLARADSNLWNRLVHESAGQAHGVGGLLTWHRLTPRESVAEGPNTAVSEDDFLVIAGEITSAEWAELFAGVRQRHLMIAVMLSLLAFASLRFLRARRRAQEELGRSEESLAVTLQSIGDAVLATDAQGRVTRLNPVAEHLTGFPQVDAVGRPVSEVFKIINEQTRQPAVIPVESVLQTGIVQGLANHTILIARDGSERPIADSAAPIRDREGGIIGVVLVFRDVSATHAAQRALRESEARYRSLFESIDEGFCIIEMIFDEQARPVDYRFLQVNPSFEKQTGLRDAVGKRMRELAPQHEAHWFEIYGRIAVTGEAARFQNRAEQLHRWYDVYAFRFGQPQHRQVAILFSDITERKQMETEILRRSHDVQSANQQLRAVNQELEAFSYSVSHDLRAPLRHIDGYVEMLTRDAGDLLSDKSRRYLKIVSESVCGMGRLIDDLLEFSRMGRAEMQRTTVNLERLVQDLITNSQSNSTGRNIYWKNGGLPMVEGDPSMLKQVFVNLLSNAVKYTRRRNPAEIEIGCARETDDEVVVFVRDNGAGFDMKYAHKLFGVFQRLHRAEEFEGTGVGLANVRRIITRHGGRVWAESAIDSGATFYLSLTKRRIG